MIRLDVTSGSALHSADVQVRSAFHQHRLPTYSCEFVCACSLSLRDVLVYVWVCAWIEAWLDLDCGFSTLNVAFHFFLQLLDLMCPFFAPHHHQSWNRIPLHLLGMFPTSANFSLENFRTHRREVMLCGLYFFFWFASPPSSDSRLNALSMKCNTRTSTFSPVMRASPLS